MKEYIVFYDNDTGEIYPFTSKAKALEFAKSEWIEKILHRDEQNAVIVAVAIPVTITAARKISPSAGTTLAQTLFVADEKGEWTHVDIDEFIEDKGSYFRAKRLIKRIDATFKESGKYIWSIDREAIRDLLKKLKNTTLAKS